MKHNDPMADIALVGPGGRDKLKKLIKSLQDSTKEGENAEYVIAQALNELNDRIATLENAPTTPQTHILEIISFSANSESEGAALARLKLDGKTPTFDDLKTVNVKNTVVTQSNQEILPLIMNKSNQSFGFVCGVYYEGSAIQYGQIYEIQITHSAGNDSFIHCEEL